MFEKYVCNRKFVCGRPWLVILLGLFRTRVGGGDEFHTCTDFVNWVGWCLISFIFIINLLFS